MPHPFLILIILAEENGSLGEENNPDTKNGNGILRTEQPSDDLLLVNDKVCGTVPVAVAPKVSVMPLMHIYHYYTILLPLSVGKNFGRKARGSKEK